MRLTAENRENNEKYGKLLKLNKNLLDNELSH
jgi:hypothetical protein